MRDTTQTGSGTDNGLAYAITGFGLWGLSPLYWKLLAHISVWEVLAHRILWALVFVAVLLWIRTELLGVFAKLRRPKVLAGLVLATGLIAINWVTFIWSVGSGNVLQASLGYFINPLVSVALGTLFLGERLNRAQGAAVALAASGVIFMTVSLGVLPWVSLLLALTFGFYGLVRKLVPVSALEGHFAETFACAPLALGFLIWMQANGAGQLGHGSPLDVMLLVLAGPFTAVPLMLFAMGARRLRLSTLGLTQYIAPTTHFLLATLIFGEAFTLMHLVTFALIWSGLALYSHDAFRKERARRAALKTA